MAFDGKSTLPMKNSIGHTRPLSRKMQASRVDESSRRWPRPTCFERLINERDYAKQIGISVSSNGTYLSDVSRRHCRLLTRILLKYERLLSQWWSRTLVCNYLFKQRRHNFRWILIIFIFFISLIILENVENKWKSISDDFV